MTKQPSFYDRALRRIVWMGAALAIAGTVYVAARYGLRSGAGFLAGAALSLLNFHGLRRVVEGLSGAKSAGFRASPVFWTFRYGVLFAVGYAIFKVLEISAAPILAGLFVAVAAIILELLYEITYART